MDHEFVNNLLQRRMYLKGIIEDKKEAIINSPEGKLRISRSNGRTQYYCRLNTKDKPGRYIGKANRQLAYALAQKEYDKKILRVAQNELNRIEALISRYEKGTVESIYETLSEPRRDIVCPIIQSDKDFQEHWQNVSYNSKGFYEDTPEYYTAKSERVRSKSEIIIADILDRRHIPYRYEYPLTLEGNGIIHPDFMVLNVRLRKEYYWEHLGMMDDPQYAQRALERIILYERHGIFPGEKLIITHETRERPLQTKLIEDMISHYLL